MLNAGVVHHVGPHRLHVKLARRLAAQGYGCLRFDFSGMGDSAWPQDAGSFEAQAARDVQQVLDQLESDLGARQFALLGICSGAAHAQAAALADERVRAVFLVDGYHYPSLKGRLHFLGRLAKAYGVLGLVRRCVRVALLRGRALRAAPVVSRGEASTGQPGLAQASVREEDRTPSLPKQRFSQDMHQLTQRGVETALMFTGSVLERFSHSQQLQDVFAPSAWLQSVHCILEAELDHTLTLAASQTVFFDHVEDWLARACRAVAPTATDVPVEAGC
jgi:pimeloyl-ACP methyl ester carboxylesterase